MTRISRPTLTQVAEQAQVSVTTASYVLNKSRKGFIGPAARERVLKVARELRYRPNALARGLRLQATSTLGLITPNFPNDYSTDFVRSIYRFSKEQGYDLLLELNEEISPEVHSKVVNNLVGRMVDGLFLFWPSRTWYFDEAVFAPVVTIDAPKVCNIPSDAGVVEVDRRSGVDEATTYLLERGRRRIALVVDTCDDQIRRDKIAGWRDAHKRAGVMVHEELLMHYDRTEEWSIERGGALGEQILAEHLNPDAIVVMNDLLAVGLLNKLSSRNLTVPDDIALIGYPGTSSMQAASVPIASINFPIDKIAHAAVKLMLSCIDQTEVPSETSDRAITLKTHFEPAASSG